MCLSAALIGGGALVGGVVQGVMGSRAASAQESAANRSADLQRYMFEQARADMQPAMQAGNSARNALAFELGIGPRPDGYGGYEASPGFGFAMEEGQRAIDRSAAARGGLFSGRTARETMRFGQGLAAQDYAAHLNRLAAMSGTGQTATTSLNALGAASAANQGNAFLSGGAARASGYNAIGNAFNDTINNAIGISAYKGWI